MKDKDLEFLAGTANPLVDKFRVNIFISGTLVQDASKKDAPADFDIDMEDPETEKAAVAIQSQFRKFQKKKQGAKS
ncbi:hypothetical protein Z043_100467 [Scleropages formosus]|uniref:Purkinje cell protein 4-like protein 1-like n=1 Tax=Scleropages formosus TaxID=113540 RepID=A0A0P7ZFU7_SCLFO|nr:hypothetical protein Z043_100467 [Scleropages formosus]